MANGTGATSPSRWLDVLSAALSNRTYSNQGVGGETSTQVATRQAANSTLTNWTCIYWCGHNNLDSTSLATDLAAMIARQRASDGARFVILLPVQNASNAVGSTAYNNIVAMRNSIQSTWPNNYIDIPAALLASGNGGGTDNSDIANGYTPTSLRADTIHLNASGQAVVAAHVKSFLDSKGW